MKNVKKIWLVLPLFLMLTPQALPSACEPYAGEWQSSAEVTPEAFSQVQSLLFESADKVLSPRGDVRLLPDAEPLAGSYRVSMEWLADVWIFHFFQGEKEVGSWRLSTSEERTFFQTDIGISEKGSGVPVLYKEIRVSGKAEPRGVFLSEAKASGLTYRLIFQGRGSRCLDYKDFNRWIFQIEGPDPDAPARKTVYYAFRGSFTN